MKHLLSIILVACFVILVAAQPLGAATAELYSGEVPVADQSVSEQQRAMPQALQQVLQKLSGLRDFEEFPGLKPALQSAGSIAITFYYRNRVSVLPDGNQFEELYLVANFSKPAVDSLLQALALPLWKPERRPLSTWLMVDDGLSRRIMPIELEYAWEDMVDAATARGLPLIRPLPDAEGVYPVDEQLLWGGYTEELAESGPVDALIIAARREGPEWNVRMNLEYMGQTWSWRNRDTVLEVALVEGMHTAIDEISAANSIAASDQEQGHIEITVTGMSSSAQYVQVLSYLQGLSLVDRVRVLGAVPGKVRFDLTLNALPDYLVRALESDGMLSLTPVVDEYSLPP